MALHAIGDGAVRQFLDALDTFKSESTLNPLELIHLAVNRSNGEAVTIDNCAIRI
jgi:predicted amidohydrolase YtcJ